MTMMHDANGTQPEDMSRSREWAKHRLSVPADLPVRFTYDGTDVRGIPDVWQPVATSRRIDANIVETVFEGTEPATGLAVRVECTEYRDYPVVEWVAWLTNAGSEVTPVISDILAMDGTVSGSLPVLYHCNGDICSEDGFAPQRTLVGEGVSLDFAPNGGRPCDGAFPYYRVMFEDGGATMAIGWPGQWAATFDGREDGIRVRVGQEKTNLRLMPGESIRTPRMTILFWTGEESRAVNLWRRWYLAHILPRPDGQPLKPLLTCEGPGDGVEFTATTEENQLLYIDVAEKRGIPFDVWWIDAGWYPCYSENHEREWPVTGTWVPDPERYPNGLKPVSDRLARSGVDLLLWFEPERVRPGTDLDTRCPEWLLRREGADNSLLNLGNTECREWLTEHVCSLIRDNGIKIYRQDFNFEPLEYWRENEAGDRQGMNENLHIQGYLRYWDDLLARNAGLWLDSCASGGRRNDLEAMRRSVPLHYTDFGYGNHPVKLAFHRTMHEWMPYFKETGVSWDIDGHARFAHVADSFSFHCSMAPMLTTGLDIRRDDYDYDLAQRMIGIWRRAADLVLHGDFYPLTPFHHDAEKWVVSQFDCPETGLGFIQGIRLPECEEETITIMPSGIHSESAYLFENAETGETLEANGADLNRDGFTFALPKRSGALCFYRRELE